MRQILLAVAALTLVTPLAHASIVVPNSTFDVGLGLYDTKVNQFARFNQFRAIGGGTTTFAFEDVAGTITESESTLSSGQQQISITILGSSDLFATPGTNPYASAFDIGSSQPLQFTSPFNLGSATATYRTATGASVTTNFGVAQSNPFNGAAYAPGTQILVSDTANHGYNELDIKFTSAAAVTPEPASFLLSGTGLLGFAGMLRRRLRA